MRMTILKLLISIGVVANPYVYAQSNSVTEIKEESNDNAPTKANRFLNSLAIEINFQPYRNGNDEKSTEAMTQKWLNVCKSIGQTLKPGAGPWNAGAFKKTRCTFGDKSAKGKPTDWLLAFKQTDVAIEVSLSYRSEAAQTVTYATMSLSGPQVFLDYVQDEEFIDLIVMTLMDQMPFFMQIAPSQVEMDGKDAVLSARYPRIGASRERKFKLNPPPKELTLYTLEMDAETGRFNSRVVGRAKLDELEPVDAKTMQKNRGKRNAPQGWAHYVLDAEAAKVTLNRRVWAHSSEGRGRRAKELSGSAAAASHLMTERAKDGELTDLLESGFDTFTNALLDTAASGYVGLRYGKQILTGDELLSKTSFVGLLTEVRGGPLSGLRVYYDVLPETSVERDGFETSIGWNRLIFGTSFTYNPGFLVDKLDLTPKLGVWTLNAVLPTEETAAGQVAATSRFEFKRQFGFGVEAGAELSSDWYVVRGWYGFDMALSLGKIGGSSVKSSRFGVDAFMTAGPTFEVLGASLKTAILAFMFYESVELEKTGKSAESTAAGEISGISYDGGYAGLGAAISW